MRTLSDRQRSGIAKIMEQVIEESFSVEQLDIILHTCLALTWSPESSKIARVAYGLTKEIIHRDIALYKRPYVQPHAWENLLPVSGDTRAERMESGIEIANQSGFCECEHFKSRHEVGDDEQCLVITCLCEKYSPRKSEQNGGAE